MDLLLTAQERERFAGWLEREAASSEAIAAQMETSSIPQVLTRKLRAEAAACKIVASILRSTEDMSIGSNASS